MAILNPNHLFEQAEKLLAPPAAGPPRQVDLRRAISAAYYGVFHFVLTAAANEFVGVTGRTTGIYSLVYRSIDHKALRDLCSEAKKPQLSAKFQKYLPPSGLGPDIRVFANAVVELQAKRHSADYDPTNRVTMSDAILAVATARRALGRFQQASGQIEGPSLRCYSFRQGN